MRFPGLRDVDPLSVEYFLPKDDYGRVPAFERTRSAPSHDGQLRDEPYTVYLAASEL